MGRFSSAKGRSYIAARTDGSTVRRIAQAWAYGGQSPHRESEPTVGSMIPFDVAPDGGQVAFATCRYPRPGAESSDQHGDYQYELALVATGGGDVRRLTANETFDGYPAWSPDGRRIAFLRELTSEGEHGGAGELVTVAANGTDARRVVVGQDLNLHSPAWSPDGERLAFVANRQLYVVDADSPHVYDLRSGVLRPLATTISAPAWSPDGGRLAYAKDLGSHVGVYTIAPNGSAERLLGRIDLRRPKAWPLAFGSVRSVAWSPDGSKLLLSVPRVNPEGLLRSIYVVDTGEAHPSELEIPIPAGNDDWRPRAAAWAPDGSRIAVVAERFTFRRQNLPFPVMPVVLLTVVADGTDLRVLAQGRFTDTEENFSYFIPRMEALGPLPGAAAVDPAACSAGVVVPDPATNPGLVQDCVALLEVQQDLQHGASLNWSVDRPLSAWEGVVVGGSPPRVRELRLESRDLGGSMSPAVGQLADLRVLLLGYNRLTGRIPRELGQLANLNAVRLDGNRLTGCVPAGLRPTKNYSRWDQGLPRCEAGA